jgi:uncharacterized YccA/Bax inhibitor family protein
VTAAQHALWWYTQAVISTAAACVFAVVVIRRLAAQRQQPFYRRRFSADRGTVVTLGLCVISLGNVVTSYATAIASPGLRDVGGLMVRGALVSLCAYLWASDPGPRIRRADDALERGDPNEVRLP